MPIQRSGRSGLTLNLAAQWFESRSTPVDIIKSDDIFEIFTIPFFTMEIMVTLESIDGGERITVSQDWHCMPVGFSFTTIVRTTILESLFQLTFLPC